MFDIPFLDLPPMQAAHGTVRLPGSKSISNRVLLLAGLSAGCTRIHELLDSDDTRVMLQALRTLGCEVQQEPAHAASVTHAATVSPASPPEMADRTTAAPGEAARTGPVWRVTGLGGQLKVRQAQLFLGNAGTAMRPLTAALALLAATQGGRFELSGVARMHERPIGDLVDALRPLGCHIEDLGQPGYPPLRVWGEAGGLLALHRPIRVRGDVSSQFLTALLLALPLASAQAEPVIEVEGELISKPYIEITLKMLARFGIEVQREGFERFLIPRGSQYRSPGDIHVEGDASSASYFIALGALAAGDGRSLRVEGVGAASVQGDIRFVEAAQAMGASVTSSANALQVRRGAWPLHPITMDCNAIPDAAMTLAVMALYASGPSRLNNIGSWRVKETDRIAAMACELRKLGAQVHEGPDFIEIHPPAPAQWRSASLRTYDDHRMAMCLSLAAFNPLAGAQPPATLRIQDPRCVAKTFPDYFETLFEVAQASPGLIPVIAVDGPSASGKGTLSQALAQRLGYRLLDSGAIYRAAGVAAQRAGLDPEDASAVAALARQLALRFEGERVLIDDQDLTEEVRSEQGGLLASRVSVHPEVRAALHELQLSFRQLPGLVADGRDMGTVVFPDAPLKVFLTASAEQRAERRHKQLISKGITANIRDLLADLRARDARDASRASSPLKPAEDALLLDNSNIGIDQSVDQVLGWWAKRRPF